jgi:phage shock protein A
VKAAGAGGRADGLLFLALAAIGGIGVGIARRIAELYEAKMNAALDRATDPREMLDYSYVQMQDLLTDMRRGAAEIHASRKAAELQISELQRAADRLAEQAEQAVAAGREDLARQALARRTAILDQVADAHDEQAALRAEEEKLSAAQRRLEAKLGAFRIRKETLKATYTAARAHASIAEAFTGISGDVTDADAAGRRAEERAAQPPGS